MLSKPQSRWATTLAYVAPYAAFVTLLQLDRVLAIDSRIFYPLRFAAVLALLLWLSRPYLDLRPRFPLGSVTVGVAVFLIWIGPDLLLPGYRNHWLFDNLFTGSPVSSVPANLRGVLWFTILRTLTSVALVPVLEELFWRGWLMRWLIASDFRKVALGTYVPWVFCIVAFLFASEHGSYWDVGFVAGLIYNGWIVKCRNLGDCILAHAVTNGLLTAYVLMAGQWQYWL